MAWLYKQPTSPNWYIGLTTKEQEILQRKNFSTGTANKREANDLLKETKDEIRLIGKAPKPQPKLDLTLSQAFELMKEDRANTKGAYSVKTTEGYDESIKKVVAACGDKFIWEFDRNDYHTFINSIAGIQNTKATHSRRIYALFNFLVREKYLTENPFKRVSEKQKEVIIKTKEEMTALLEYSKKTKFYWYVRFQKESAFRMNEVLTTTVDKIEKNIIRVTRKGNIPNFIPIIKRMRKLLSEMPMPDEGRLFPFSTDAVWRFFKRFRVKTGIHIVSHDLRKYMLSEMANSGVSINYTKDYAGHKDIKTTLKYYVRSDKMKMAEDIDEKLEN